MQDGEHRDPLAVCSLPPEGMSDRLAWIRSEVLPHAIAREATPDSVIFELEDAPGLADKLDRLVALEGDCCSSIAFEHTSIAGSGHRRLVVRGVDPKAPIFGGLGPTGPGGPPPRV